MLLNLREYHRLGAKESRPRGRLDQVLALLARPGLRTVALAGGDTLLGSVDPSVEAVVDLQGLGLDQIVADAGRLRIGAMVTRTDCQRLSRTEDLTTLIAAGARHWSGSLQRNRATVGGAVAVGAANDALVVALLACDASVVLYTEDGTRELPLAEFLPARAGLLAGPALITDVIVPQRADREYKIGAALETVGRSPADAPIVVAAAVLEIAGGHCRAARLALGGVASAPIRLTGVEQRLSDRRLEDSLIRVAAEQVSGMVSPAGDFRGSGEYRRTIAGVLSERVLRQAWHRAQ